MSIVGWATETYYQEERMKMSTTTPTATSACASLTAERRPSALHELRALAPARRMSHTESLRLAAAQATRLRELLGVTTDWFPTELIAALPRIVVEAVDDLPVSGASFWGGGSWHIHVHADEPATHRRFTVLHELKHIIDHPMQKTVYDERAFVVYGERELIADYFAACLLIPETRLKRAYARSRNHDELAARFGVTTRRLLLRLSEIGRTDTIEFIPLRTIRDEDYLLEPTPKKERRIA